MPRYYESKSLIDFIKNNTPHINGETTMQCVVRAIQNAPTADVVPECEVERLKTICNSYALQYGTVRDQQKVIDEAKREVAAEIFEEIDENILGGHFLKSYEWHEEEYAKLKKKFNIEE